MVIRKTIRKAPNLPQVSPKRAGLSSVKGRQKKSLKAKSVKKMVSAFCDSDIVTITHIYPVITVSEANIKEHWTKSAKRHKQQKNLVRLYYRACWAKPALPISVRITRLAPRSLDYDNLVISQKYLVDALCEELTGDYRPGRADSDDRIKIRYGQEKSREYGVKVVFE